MEDLSLNAMRMEVMQKYSALETRTSVGVQTRVVMRLQAHIVGELLNVLVKVGDEIFFKMAFWNNELYSVTSYSVEMNLSDSFAKSANVDIYRKAAWHHRCQYYPNLICSLLRKF